MRLVGITGKAGAGKDTVGRWLNACRYYECYAIAQPLKAGLAAMGFPEPSDRDEKETIINGFDFSWRDAAQKLGTEWGRNLDEDIWLKLAEQKIKNSSRLAITDLRFENEAAMIRRHKGIILHITGRGVELGKLSAHASETGLRKQLLDYEIDNSGTEDFLFFQLARIFHE